MTLLLGSLGYSLYIGSYLAMEIHPNAGGFVIAASSILGTAFCPMWKSEELIISPRYLRRLVMDGTWCFGPRLSHRVEQRPLHIYLLVCIQFGSSNRSIRSSWAEYTFESQQRRIRNLYRFPYPYPHRRNATDAHGRPQKGWLPSTPMSSSCFSMQPT
jgi:hypothetical protein